MEERRNEVEREKYEVLSSPIFYLESVLRVRVLPQSSYSSEHYSFPIAVSPLQLRHRPQSSNMASGGYQVPDLSTILRTLSAYIPAQGPSQAIPGSTTSLLQQEASLKPTLDCLIDREEGEYSPSASPEPQEYLEPKTVPEPRRDPQAILSWPSALRFVTTQLAPNPTLLNRIHKLVQTQRSHEKAWWAGREALFKKQQERDDGSKSIAEVL